MLMTLIFTLSLSVAASIGLNENNTYFDIDVFNCNIKISNKYRLLIGPDAKVHFATSIYDKGGTLSFIERKGNYEDKVDKKKVRILKKLVNNGLDYILFSVVIKKTESYDFAMIRDKNIQMIISGDDVSDILKVYESCILQRKKIAGTPTS